MAETIKMPKNGLTMREGMVAKIHIAKGSAVKQGDPLIEYETDKITGEIVAPRDGVILELFVAEGDTVEVLAPLCIVGEKDESVSGPEKPAERTEDIKTAPAAAKKTDMLVSAAAGVKTVSSPLAKRLAKEYGLQIGNIQGTGPKGWIVRKDIERERENVKATPLAKSIAMEKGVDLHRVTGTGPNGRIQKADVLATASRITPAVQAAAAPVPGGRREKMSSMRRTIGQRLAQSKQTIPHVYFKCEADATSLLEVKNTYSAAMQKKYGQKLSVNDIVLAAAAAVLSEFPNFSAQIDGDEMVYMDTVHLGFAVSLDNGLIVPVIRSAQNLTLAALSREAARLTGKAKAMQLSGEEITGGTFTVSNLGGYGMEEFFAIINPPESGILAVGAAIEKPVAVNGTLVIRPVMTLCLSVDHRIIDGAVAAAFMKRLKETLEDAYQLLI